MRKKINSFVLILLMSSVLYGQESILKTKKEEQPMADELFSLNEDISIPVFTIIAGNISYPISLKYNISGISVDDVASDVGLGWELSDSFVYREVNDKIDVNEVGEYGGFYPAFSPSGYEDPNIPLYQIKRDYYNILGYQKVKQLNILENYNTNIGKLDHEPDIFNVNTPYFFTSFYYPDDLNVAKELTSNNTIIRSVINPLTRINYTSFKMGYNNIIQSFNRAFAEYQSFSITQDNGIISTFNEADWVHHANMIKMKNYSPILYSNNSLGTPFPEKWHISEMYDPVTTRKISFEYETFSTEDSHLIEINHYKSINKPYYQQGVSFQYNYKPGSGFVTNDCYIFHDTGEDEPTEYSRMYKRYLKKKRIKKITFDQGFVEFIYAKDREDFKNGKALTRIEIRNTANQLINSFNLSYDYFESEQYRNEFSKRLKLTAIQTLDGGKYSFEYYEGNKMPQIGSYNKDFYGYCNTSNDDLVNPNDESTLNYPILYYYPDKYGFSLLPYNISGQKKLLIEGSVNKEPNELAKTWSLKKITYPKGGFTQYNLETNVFNLWEADVKGPGVRIASKIIATSDQDTNARQVLYNYNSFNGTSSGKIYNLPLVGYPVKQLFTSYEDDNGVLISQGASYNGESNLYKSFLIYQALSKSKAIVKYSDFAKAEGSKRVTFENQVYTSDSKRYYKPFTPNNGINNFRSHCISEFIFTNSGLGIDNNSYIISYPKITRFYEGNSLVKEIEMKYKNSFNKNDFTGYAPYNDKFLDVFIRNANTSFDIYPSYNYENILSLDKHFFTRNNYLLAKKETYFYPSGSINNLTNYYYNYNTIINDPILSAISTKDSNSNIYITNIVYPERETNLISYNMLNTPIEIIKTRNTDEIFHQKNLYNKNSIQPSSVSEMLRDQSYKPLYAYHLYDNKGNLLSFTNEEGISTTILYGYNQTYPIAVIEGPNYSSLMQELMMSSDDPSEYLKLDIVKKSDLDKSIESEQLLISALDALRVQLNDRDPRNITTYTYDPLIGVTSVTPPTGIRETYIYGIDNKLKEVRDLDGKILTEYTYKYK